MNLVIKHHTTTLRHADVLLNSGDMHYAEAEAYRSKVAKWVGEISEGEFTAKPYTLNYGGIAISRTGATVTCLHVDAEDGPCILRHTSPQQGEFPHDFPSHSFHIISLRSDQ